MYEQIKTMESKMKKNTMLLIIFLIATFGSALFAIEYDEDQQTMQQYKLPDDAVLESNLAVRDTMSYYNDKPFTGTAYALYPDTKMKLVAEYKNGMKHGLMYVWYPDGRPQMMTYYRTGHLNGRFKGWYQFGGVVYDLILRDGHYTGDELMDTDATRNQNDTPEGGTPQEGKDQSNGE
jgi:antitoxin component YwqK of YwqJK toxin-antitoxin module